jgi:nucleoside-diphosphate-sugar epimerase
LLPRWVILRFGTTVGPEMRPALATWIFLNQAHNNEPFTITGNGRQSRNWIYVEDLVEGCYLAFKNYKSNEIFNLVGEKSYTIYRMAEMCAEIVNRTAKNSSWKYLPAREGDVFIENISIEKAKRMLGWKPKTNLKEALRKSYEGVFK